MTRVRIIWFVIALVLVSGLPQVASAQDGAVPQAKVQQLIDLLNDPEIRAVLETTAPEAVAPAQFSLTTSIMAIDAAVRSRIMALGQGIARFPRELATAAGMVARDVNAGRPGIVLAILAALIALGLFAEAWGRRVLSRSTGRRERVGIPAFSHLLLGEILPLLVFVTLTVGTFWSFGWPPLLRRVVLTYLFAFIAFRAVMAAARLLNALDRASDPSPTEGDVSFPVADRGSRFWYRRTGVFLGFSSSPGRQ